MLGAVNNYAPNSYDNAGLYLELHRIDCDVIRCKPMGDMAVRYIRGDVKVHVLQMKMLKGPIAKTTDAPRGIIRHKVSRNGPVIESIVLGGIG